MLLVLPTLALTLGPASLSVPELAQALTKAGMPTEYAPVLADRAAYVCLKDRSPESIRKLLGEGLGVVFREEGKGWRIVVDPEVRERERLFLVAYKRQAVEATRTWAAERDRVRAGRSYEALKAWVNGAAAELEKIPKDDDRLSKEAPPVFDAATLLRPAMWIGVRAARDANLIGVAFARLQHWTLAPETAQRTLGLPLPSEASAVNMTMSFDIMSGLLTISADLKDAPLASPVRIAAGGTRFPILPSADAVLSLEGKTIDETFGRMSNQASDYIKRFASTGELPESPVVERGSLPFLSNVLEGLGAKGQEAVMELSPRFEALTKRPLPSFLSLRSTLDAGERRFDSAYPEWARVSIFPPIVPLKRRFPWRARQQDGVWMVANPLAFLDRVQPISPVPYLRAERFLARLPAEPDAPSWLYGGRVLTWRQLNDFVRELGPDADRLNFERYRNVPAWMFGRLAPLTRFAARIPAHERGAFWKAATDKDEPAKIAVEGGELSVRASTIANRFGGPISARIGWSWRSEDGAVVAGDGMLDAKGLGD